MVILDILRSEYEFLLEIRRLRETPGRGYDMLNRDLTVGEIGEKLIRQLLKQEGYEVKEITHVTDDLKELIKFDIIAFKDGVEETFEVKLDLKVFPGTEIVNIELPNGVKRQKEKDLDAGNLFVEVKCSNHFSGIIRTTSKFFITILFFIGEMWVAESKKLKYLVTHTNFPIVPGGQNFKTRGALIDREYNKKHFNVIEFQLNIIDDLL